MSSKPEFVTLDSPFSTGARNSKHKRRDHSWLLWFFSDSWALEYLSLTIAIVALVGIAITLALYNGQPLQTWPRSLAINTVLSALATIMKGFLLMPVCACLGQLKWLWYTRQTKSLQHFQIFDNASRGPWGAVQLLFCLKFWHIASIGSLVTLLSLASDAFVQQSVSFPLRVNSQINNSATVPYAQFFDSFFIESDYFVMTTQSMMGAVYDGVFSKNLTRSASSVTGYCPTGNCTYPSFASLAVCSSCQNVSSLLQYTSEPNRLGTVYNYTLRNGHQLAGAQSSLAYLNITASGDAYRTLELNSDDLSLLNSPATITNVSMIIGGNLSEPWAQTAWDCVFSFCAKSYNASESLSLFNETPLDVFDEIKPALRPLPPSQSSANYTPLYAGTRIFDVPSTHLTTIGQQNRTFTFNPTAQFALQSSLQKTLTSQMMQNVQGEYVFTNGIAQGFYYNGLQNVAATMDNIADALTNAMRMSSGQQIQGIALTVQAHIQVQWWWLLLPLVMGALGVIFVGLTAWRTRIVGIPSWRTSILAVMEHGVTTSIYDNTSADSLSGSQTDLATNVENGLYTSIREDDEPTRQERTDTMATIAGKEKVSDLEVWAEDVSVRLQRRGIAGRGYGLTAARRT